MSSKSSQSARGKRVFAIPILGYLLRMGWDVVRLPKHIEALRHQAANTQHSAQIAEALAAKLHAEVQATMQQTQEHVETIASRQVSLDSALVEVKHSLRTKKSISGTSLGVPATVDPGSKLFADDHQFDDFYVAFENKFRGSEAEITDRLRVYLPSFKKLAFDFSQYPVLDIGCGRGELLALLAKEHINCIGLDLNESMVERCNQRGFTAVQAEALTYLSQQPSGSLGAITGFHIVEHIPFNFLLRLLEECYRVLTPGGIIIFETPNPENTHVGSFSFYYDPSHLHPLAPEVLAFAVENRGFEKADIVRLHPKNDDYKTKVYKDPLTAEVVKRFFMEQDYAIIGHKAGPIKITGKQ